MENYVLSDGLRLPKVGFGTYLLNGAQGVNTIVSGIQTGYRLLDSAFNYENEGALGRAVKRAGVNRSDLIITSKLPGRHYGFQDAISTIQESLYRAGLDYYDLYLLHWPNPKRGQYVEAWQALIQAQKFGLIRSIGVCNFLPEHLDKLEKETGVMPVINQIELHPYFNQQAQRDYDAKHNILTEDWSPLGRASQMLKNDTLIKLAAKYNKNVGQLILRWEVQLGTLPIPKASSPTRQAGNMDLFDFVISDGDMAMINSLTKPNGRNNDQDPAEYEEF
ncbi:aldo/keto reductase [Oenococcus kitaharae]|uniref:Oxidoreductase of aldo/keto reductase family n=1 Tax=Oenococcus kitaharae DSM 17330 TaxID=1045004 RepID=G9WGH9_9LACO|nr:aldo/keto reductase [Oenococcus kitaharae]EHN59806.1 oxidoreductase of aldo/keto reductase family [Oenococcus kitaharae DSM 17330]OEY83622.1 2,5-diketo-D-gluconic acid reductase [Oenococcus kitaharae]OEY85420.1 2,5-diketo-D-gluconic acid reductase [Oenococcus kitaharae]OEY86273.1 2,5-diketo-D-gluconic acid reductase [Oenococcus kitaharae]